MQQSLLSLFNRDLNQLIKEVNGYQNKSSLWAVESPIANSGGNLVLHICGNLQHFVGAVLGKSGYVRQREQEFECSNIAVADLIIEINTTLEVVKSTFDKLTADIIQSNYPVNVFGKEMTTEYFLLHLSTHLNYHLGQVNYHRRLLDKPL